MPCRTSPVPPPCTFPTPGLLHPVPPSSAPPLWHPITPPVPICAHLSHLRLLYLLPGSPSNEPKSLLAQSHPPRCPPVTHVLPQRCRIPISTYHSTTNLTPLPLCTQNRAPARAHQTTVSTPRVQNAVSGPTNSSKDLGRDLYPDCTSLAAASALPRALHGYLRLIPRTLVYQLLPCAFGFSARCPSSLSTAPCRMRYWNQPRLHSTSARNLNSRLHSSRHQLSRLQLTA